MDAHLGLAPGKSVLQTDDSTLHHVRDEMVGLTNGTRTRTAAFTGRDAAFTSWSTLENGGCVRDRTGLFSSSAGR